MKCLSCHQKFKVRFKFDFKKDSESENIFKDNPHSQPKVVECDNCGCVQRATLNSQFLVRVITGIYLLILFVILYAPGIGVIHYLRNLGINYLSEIVVFFILLNNCIVYFSAKVLFIKFEKITYDDL